MAALASPVMGGDSKIVTEPPAQVPMTVKKRKIAVIGFRCVGKTTLCKRWIEPLVLPNSGEYIPTIEQIFTKEVTLRNTGPLSVEVVDTAGKFLRGHFFLSTDPAALPLPLCALLLNFLSVSAFRAHSLTDKGLQSHHNPRRRRRI